jgi:excisionase family DNA binding protein
MKSEAAETPHYAGPIKVMTVREVSAYLQVHPSTIYRLLKRHQIPAFHVGSDWRFNIEEIDRWLSASVNTGFRGGRTLVRRATEMVLKAHACPGTLPPVSA